VSGRLLKSAVPVILLLSLQNPAQAATCSCAGVPLLSYIDTSAIDKGQLFINYTAEDHEISDLVSGTQDVPDETRRERNSFSHVVSASYAFTDHWSISGLVSYVEHFRLINSSFLGETTSSGIGDSVLLARYTPLAITPFSRHQFSVGLGARIPTGDDDAGGDFVLSEDMQPSIGAYGAIIWTQYSYAFNQAATLLFHTSANYTYNGENDRKYRFGHDFYVSAGMSQSVNTWFSYSLGLRYRNARADERLGFEIPNTGGEWLDIIPAIQFGITDRFSAALSGRYPLWRDLNGTLQFTTSYSYALSLTYGF
jgi:hypothetical protein